MRLFLAVEPDRAAQGQIARLLLDVQRALGDETAMLRWTPAANVHVTLHFLGELQPADAARLVETLGPALTHPAFDVVADTIGLLPAGGVPRVLYAGMSTGADALGRIYDLLGERVRRARVPTETRAFVPHMTLARVRDRERGRARALRDRIAAISMPPIRWTVEGVTLFRSDLSGSAPRYDPVHRMAMTSA